MHRLWTFLLSFVLSVSLTGCGGEPRPPAGQAPGPQQAADSQRAAAGWDSLSFSYTARELPAQVDGHAIYGEIYIPDNARAQFTALENVPEQVSFFSWLTVGRRYVEDVWEYDVYGDVSTYERDVLLLHGDRDGTVDLSCSRRAIEEYPSAELKVIEGAGHGFSGGNFDLAMEYILDYLSNQLN